MVLKIVRVFVQQLYGGVASVYPGSRSGSWV